MSDFDKILRDKLNEDESFPRMDRNWQRVYSRLPVEPIAPKFSWGHWAVAASIAVLIGSSVWFWHELNKTKSELAQMKELKTNNEVIVQPKQDTNSANDKIIDNNTSVTQRNLTVEKENNGQAAVSLEKTTDIGNQQNVSSPSMPRQNGTISTPNLKQNKVEHFRATPKQNVVDNNNTPSVFEQNTKQKMMLSEPKKELVQTPIINNKIEPSEINNPNTVVNPNEVIKSTNNSDIVKNEVVKSTQESPITVEQNSTNNKDIVDNKGSKNDLKENKKNDAAANIDSQNIKSDNTVNKQNLDNQQDMPTKIAAVNESTSGKPVETASENKSTETIAKANTSQEEKKQEELITKPIVQPFKWRPTVSIAANGLYYIPKNNDEIPSSTGYGVSLRIGITERFHLETSYEKSQASYKFTVPKPRFHHPKLPSNRPPSIDFELKEIEGRQSRGQFSLNLNYLLTTDKWINPYVAIGYAVQRVSTQKAEFKFFDKRTGEKVIEVQSANPQSFNNLWNAGVGVEKPIVKGLNLMASVTYQKDFSNKIDDSWLMRGGLRYNF